MTFPEEVTWWADSIKDKIRKTAHLRTHDDDMRALRERLESEGRMTPFQGGTILSLDETLMREMSDLFTIDDRVLDDKPLVARIMFDYLGHKFGFRSYLEQDLFALYPHELRDSICPGQMMANYFPAKACNLDPDLWEVTLFRREKSHFAPSHCFVTVDVGADKRWIVDQTYRLLGPISWDGNNLVVENIISEETERYETADAYQYSEEEYAERVEYQRSDRGAMSVLVPGQKIEYGKFDGWKARKPLTTEWYVRYNPDERALVSLIPFNRPLMQSRGLENKLIIDEQGTVTSEVITGYFHRQADWASFVRPIPLVKIGAEKAKGLIEGLTELDVKGQYAFEDHLMSLFDGNTLEGKDLAYANEITDSYKALQQTRYSVAVEKIALVEALYQERKGKSKFINGPDARFDAFKMLAGQDPQARAVVRLNKILRQLKKRQRKGDKAYIQREERHGRLVTLFGIEGENEDTSRYRTARTPIDVFEYQAEHEPPFFDDATDRILFVRRSLEDHAGSADDLREHARSVFGDKLEQATMKGYARIFAEFLGHMAHSWNQLKITEFREKLIKKAKEYNPVSA
ncbi:hypothetical protein COV18_05360 [Candidatus Woesearchaeota archaeon CG10_big_fil_rev_8_21_14_0_10_37_12]|nr:MAG: hypothetical protein COV18_05360 [Candidatus Woesearchaeota archaeon CG10_big_fil_rev_8_21_14_0_10_37_12]